jgi:hypothetical protein
MDFKCDELILGKTDADSRALTSILRVEHRALDWIYNPNKQNKYAEISDEK